MRRIIIANFIKICIVIALVIAFFIGWGIYIVHKRTKKSEAIIKKYQRLRTKYHNKFKKRSKRLEQIKPPRFYDSSLSKKTNHEINVIINKEFEARKRLIFGNLLTIFNSCCSYCNKIIWREMFRN